MYEKVIKRTLDIFLGTILAIVTLPIQLVVATLVRKKIGSPVLFKQSRPGKDEKPFEMFKFRTMTDETDSEGNLLPDEERLTPFGSALRATSLDELPELYSVIKGDMSLVGPRPLLFRYLPRYTPEQARRHEVKPGVTGLAQVSGRNQLSWEEKFTLDVEYVDNVSLKSDVAILFKTVRAVVFRQGISHDGHATMHEFGG